MIKEYIVKKSVGNQSGRVFSQKEVGELVRCKDCKHHEDFLFDDDKVLCWVHDVDIVVAKNGYCSYGERKEQEHE